jgi:O-antigen ligase
MGQHRRKKRQASFSQRTVDGGPPTALKEKKFSLTWGRTVTAITALLLIFTPFIFDPRLVYPGSNSRYDIPRDTFFLVLATLLVTAWIIQEIWQREMFIFVSHTRRMQRYPLFTLWETMPFLSLATLRSFLIGILLYFTLSRSLLPSHVTLLLQIQVLTAGLVGLHCLLQYLGTEPLGWFVSGQMNPAFGGRGAGYIGNAAHAGNYLAPAIPLGVALACASSGRPLRCLTPAAGVVLTAVGIFTTGSRGGIFGALCGLGVLFILSAPYFSSFISLGWRRLVPVTLLLLLALLLVSPWLSSTPTWGRMYTTWEGLRQGEWERVLGSRPGNWRLAWAMVQDHPLTGIGVGTFVRNHGRYLSHGGWHTAAMRSEATYEHAHNEFLQVWAEAGTPAVFIAVIGTVALLAWGVVQSVRADYSPTEWWVVTGLTASVATVFATALIDYIFHLSVTALPAILFAAGLGVYSREEEKAPVLSAPRRTGLRLAAVLCAAGCGIFLLQHNLRPLRGLYAENRGDFLAYITATRPFPEAERQRLLSQAEEEYRHATETYPSVTAYLGLGHVQLRQQKYKEGIANLHQALGYMEAAEIYSLLGEAYMDIGDFAAAEGAFTKSLNIYHTSEAAAGLARVQAAHSSPPDGPR